MLEEFDNIMDGGLTGSFAKVTLNLRIVPQGKHLLLIVSII